VRFSLWRAPSAERTASSVRRPLARASISDATLAHAMSRTRAVSAMNTTATRGTRSATARSGRARNSRWTTNRFPSSSAGYWCCSCVASTFSALCAVARLTPFRKRPMILTRRLRGVASDRGSMGRSRATGSRAPTHPVQSSTARQ